eukprot:CCRYP_008913-RA/>CCRYP_008913-RA protein AED:0.38 eAED:0.38 QI:0/-1/0/1/-1/1/1/0/62
MEAAQQNVIGALLTFVATFIISMFFIWKNCGVESDYDMAGNDKNHLNIDLKRDYGAVQTDSY